MLIFCLLLSSCKSIHRSNVHNSELSNQVSVTGIAKNAKLGAIVTTDVDSVYYINNLDTWPENVINKKVLVQGNLNVIYQEKEVINGKTKPYIPRRNVLYDATFKTLEK